MTPTLKKYPRDLTGAVFGRLTVVARVGVAGNGVTLWACQCTCGQTITVRRGNLLAGHTSSCGCFRAEVAGAWNRGRSRELRPCTVDGCDRLERKGEGGMCARHAQRVRRYGDPHYQTPEEIRRANNRAAQPRLGQLKQTTYKKLHGRHEHRAVMEAHIGRPLRSDEIVHHIDGDQHNNAIENLQIVTKEEHARIHAEQGDMGRQTWRRR